MFAYCGFQSQSLLVESCGIVVEVVMAAKYTLFAIDDSTSVLQCLLWAPSSDRYPNGGGGKKWSRTGGTGGMSAESAVWAEVSKERYEATRRGLVLGAQVKVQGKVHAFRGQTQLKVMSVCPLRDANVETEHRLDTERLHRLVYLRA